MSHDIVAGPAAASVSGRLGILDRIVVRVDAFEAARRFGAAACEPLGGRRAVGVSACAGTSHTAIEGIQIQNPRSTAAFFAGNRGGAVRTFGRGSGAVIMNISEPFIQRPVATSLLMAAIGFVGLVAVPFLPVAPLPQVDFPTISVNATLQGASAETMAASVAAPLERQFGQIPGVTQLTSVSALNSTSITIQFELNRNINSAAQDVQAAITVAGKTLPRDMSTPPSYKKVNPADSPILILAAQSDTLPLTTVNDYADNFVAQQISQVPGVAQVAIYGEQHPAIRIQVDPAKLASSGLTLEEVRKTLVGATTIAAKGTVNTVRTSFTIAANDQIIDPEPFDETIIAYRNGGPIRVRDVGQAVAGATDRTLAAFENGKQGIMLVVFKQPGANVIETVDQIKAQLPRLTKNIPPAIDVSIMQDRTKTIRASVEDVEFTLMLTIVLVVLVILLFLRNFWATLIPGITVPLALLGSFAMMYLLNFSLDNLSLMALTISVGFVVDDAIVVVENIHRHIEDGETPYDGGHQRLARDRLHGAVDQLLADRRVHPAAAHGRHHRAAVPRIRPDGHRLDRGFRAGLADACADAVRAFHAARIARTRPRLPGHRIRFRRDADVLSAHPRRRPASPGDHAVRVLRHHGADRG